ncbi:MAG: aldehyde dehydrogenase family protein [Anaerolineae bacterium]
MEDARIGQVAWEGIGLSRRLVFFRALRDALYRHQNQVIDTLVAEQGKVRHEATLEYLAVLEMLTFYSRVARQVLAPQTISVRLIPQRRYIVERRPFGVALVIAPWNYPLFLSFEPIAAALLAGNSVVYKPSEYATQVGEVIAAVIASAGIPSEVFHIVHGYGDVGAALIEAQPDRIVFTGSVPTGKKVAEAAARHLIPVTLELGGNDAAIVLDDADLEKAAAGIVWGGMFNAGQTCASVERVLVMRPVADRLLQAMRREIEQHLLTPDGRLKPGLTNLTTARQVDILESQVNEALKQGASVYLGGYRPDEAGPPRYAPTILTDVTPEMRICQEETFGPVIAVMVVDDEDEAVHLNNATVYGLTASIWTRNKARGMALAHRLNVGHVSINEHMVISGVPEVPWGGVKSSGYGRMHGRAGLLEMTYSQTIDVKRFPTPFEPFWYPYSASKQALLRRAVSLLYGTTLLDKLRGLL